MEGIEMCLCGLVFPWCFQCVMTSDQHLDFFHPPTIIGDQTWLAGEKQI
jgi:hypothetical protein